MQNQIIFYNGFNLLVDMVLAYVVYRFAYRSGWLRGYGEALQDSQKPLDKVYGYKVGDCAWCLSKKATNSYIDHEAGGELVEYQVCLSCYKERN